MSKATPACAVSGDSTATASWMMMRCASSTKIGVTSWSCDQLPLAFAVNTVCKSDCGSCCRPNQSRLLLFVSKSSTSTSCLCCWSACCCSLQHQHPSRSMVAVGGWRLGWWLSATRRGIPASGFLPPSRTCTRIPEKLLQQVQFGLL